MIANNKWEFLLGLKQRLFCQAGC